MYSISEVFTVKDISVIVFNELGNPSIVNFRKSTDSKLFFKLWDDFLVVEVFERKNGAEIYPENTQFCFFPL